MQLPVRKAILFHVKLATTMTVLVFETAHGYSYAVDNFVSMPMPRRQAVQRFETIVRQYTTHQGFALQAAEGEL